MIIPLITHLHILQLEQYEIKPALIWWLKHLSSWPVFSKTKLKLTPKAITIVLLSILICLGLIGLTLNTNFFLSLFVLTFFLFYPMPFFIASLLLILPFQLLILALTFFKVRFTLRKFPHLTIIGITGSFGKTSTKNYLFHLLDNYQPTLTTPHSYNTPFSLAHVVDWELTAKIRYFIAEFSAFRPGNIRLLTLMFPPRFALITSIGPQHLERFGSLNRIIKAKFELAVAVKPNHLIVNIDNPHIKEYLNSHPRYQPALTYSLTNPKATFYISNICRKNTVTSFTFHYQNQSFRFSAPILFTSQLQNLAAALSLAFTLKVPTHVIKSALLSLPQVPHRLELSTQNKATIIDNTYSSNANGFSQVVSDMAKFSGKKAIITPGLVELGPESNQIHQKLGQEIAAIFNTLVLVGRNPRTNTLFQEAKKANPDLTIQWVESHNVYWPTIEILSQNHTWILLENDLPENY